MENKNVFTEQSAKGTFIRKNGELVKVLRKAGINNKDTWDKILEDGGSVQGLKELDKWCYLDNKMVLCKDIKNGDREKSTLSRMCSEHSKKLIKWI